MIMWDPMYFLFIAPAVILGLWAQMRIKWTYSTAQRMPAPLSGAAAARHILDSAGLNNVGIEMVPGHLSDHYDPRRPVPRGGVVALDVSESMLASARATLADERLPVALVRADATRLPFAGALDAVFSTATFHWVLDHDALFASIFSALRPGGRLVAQCGGGPNLARARERAGALMRAAEFAPWFADWRSPWNYATPEETTARLRAAGFVEVSADLESAPATFPDVVAFRAFTTTVILRPYLARLPEERRAAFAHAFAELAARDEPPLTLDYWRLNISARRP